MTNTVTVFAFPELVKKLKTNTIKYAFPELMEEEPVKYAFPELMEEEPVKYAFPELVEKKETNTIKYAFPELCEEVEQVKYADPTPYRISTITCTASIGAEVDLAILYEHLNITSTPEKGITYVEFGEKKNDTMFKGFTKKSLINRRRSKPTKRFDNQLTIVYRITDIWMVNIKVFRNGNIQMTGVKDPDLGSQVVDILIDIVKNIYTEKNRDVISDITLLKNQKYKICLINTDFKVGFEIKRDNLFKLIVNDYKNICSYEPCIYPGVKIPYFWNSENSNKDGICNCTEKCQFLKKSGDGHGDCNCKKITVAVFMSGACIITGGQMKCQIEECYKFINNILYNNIDKIEKRNMLPEPEAKID